MFPSEAPGRGPPGGRGRGSGETPAQQGELVLKVVAFAENHNYTYEFIHNKYYGNPFEINEGISREGVKEYVKTITNIKPRDYQLEAIYGALRYNRKLLISPTATGKSLMIYAVVR